MCRDVYIHFINNKIAFEEFSKSVESLFRVESFERRESDHCISGYYFKCKVLNHEIEIEEADDSRLPEYDYVLSIKEESRDSIDMLEQFAEYWVNRGCEAALPEGPYMDSMIRKFPEKNIPLG